MAIAFAPEPRGSSECDYSLAVGLETGAISVWNVSCNVDADGSAQADASCVWDCPVAARHCASVRRLCWQQSDMNQVSNSTADRQCNMHLASCGDDHCVRIFSVSIRGSR